MTLTVLVTLLAGATPGELAAPAANAALDKAYAESLKRPDAVKQPHTGPWVSPADGRVTGDAKRGFIVQWSRFAPAGFEYEVKVSISPSGEVKVLEARAVFSPD